MEILKVEVSPEAYIRLTMAIATVHDEITVAQAAKNGPAGVEFCLAKNNQAWSGLGLPPVGVECERMWASGPASYVKVRVIAHDDGQAIYRFLEDRRKGEVQADRDGDGDSHGNPIFRPIRTPEQIAAEEREKAIEDLYFTVNWAEGRDTWPFISKARKDDYAKAIDAGYRKQVAP